MQIKPQLVDHHILREYLAGNCDAPFGPFQWDIFQIERIDRNQDSFKATLFQSLGLLPGHLIVKTPVAVGFNEG